MRYTRKLLGKTVLALSAAALASCATEPKKSPLSAAERIHSVHAVMEPLASGSIAITKRGRAIGLGGPSITEGDKASASTNARTLNETLVRGFKTRLPSIAKYYGITVARSDPSLPTLRLTAVKSAMYCADDGCVSWLTMKGELTLPSGRKAWAVELSMEPPRGSGPWDDAAFDVFARKLFEAMRNDGLLTS